MAITPAVLQGGVLLGTGPAAIYTAPAATRAVVKRAVFTNATAAAQNFTVSVSRAGGGSTAMISAQAIPANSTYLARELQNLVLAPGDSISAAASAGSSIGCVMSGFTL